MIDSKENNFLASPSTAAFQDTFRPFNNNGFLGQPNSGSVVHQFRSPMTVRASKTNYENQCPISLSKLGESSCSDFMKSCISSQDLRCNTETKQPLQLNANCDNIVQPHCYMKTPVKTATFSLSGAGSSHFKQQAGERQPTLVNVAMNSQTQTKLRLTDNDSANFNMVFENKSSVMAFSQHEYHEKDDDKTHTQSEDMLSSMHRPQGFMTAHKAGKIFREGIIESDIKIELKPNKEPSASPFVNLSSTNMRQQPLLDLKQSSLLIESGCKMTGLFSGDRFIPYRPEETHLDGCEQYLHEENLLTSSFLRVPRHHRRQDDDVSMSDSNRSRSHSTPSSNNSGSSTNSNRSSSERVHRASRRRQRAYENLLNQQCFQDSDSQSLQNLTQLESNAFSDITVAPTTREQASRKYGHNGPSLVKQNSRILKFKKKKTKQSLQLDD